MRRNHGINERGGCVRYIFFYKLKGRGRTERPKRMSQRVFVITLVIITLHLLFFYEGGEGGGQSKEEEGIIYTLILYICFVGPYVTFGRDPGRMILLMGYAYGVFAYHIHTLVTLLVPYPSPSLVLMHLLLLPFPWSIPVGFIQGGLYMIHPLVPFLWPVLFATAKYDRVLFLCCVATILPSSALHKQ